MKALWHEVLCAGVPITLHNGLIDLAFIYQHFYSILPETFSEFIVNISDWFLLPEDNPGLYDSKYIAEYITRFKASFLEYVFRKWYYLELFMSFPPKMKTKPFYVKRYINSLLGIFCSSTPTLVKLF